MSEPLPESWRERERVLEKAMALQEAEARRQEASRASALFEAAAGELGVGAEHLAAASAALAAEDLRRAREQEEAAARGRARALAAVAALVGALAVGGGVAWWTAPPPVWVGEPEVGWSLDVNAGTQAALSTEVDGDHVAATLRVDRFVADDRGEFRANLTGPAPAGGGWTHVAVTLRGTLPVVRVYLESGGDERWRSPPIQVPSSWDMVDLRLDAFEHQRRGPDGWHVVDDAEPGRLTAVSVKAGHFMNPLEAAGSVSVDRVALR